MIYLFCIVSNQFIARIHAFKYTPFSNRDRYILMLNWQKFMRTLIPFHSIQFWTICKIKLDGVWIAHGNQFSIKILPHIQPQTNSFSAVHLRIGERRKKSAQSQNLLLFRPFLIWILHHILCFLYYTFFLFISEIGLEWKRRKPNCLQRKGISLSFIHKIYLEIIFFADWVDG